MTSEKKKGYSINTTDYIVKMVNHCRKHGLTISLKNPITIQDKLAWLNIYDVNPLKVLCADKIKVHDYCKEKLGKDICIPIIKVYDSIDEIDLNELPNSFVLKCNHGSGMNIIVKDKDEFDFEDAKKKLTLWMADDFTFRNGFEAHYHDIERKIFAEEYKEDSSNGLIDYKFICFNGKPTFIQIIYDRFGPKRHMNYYDVNFNYVNLARRDFRTDPLFDHKKPERLELMLSYAETLSSDFPFVRIDFYEVNGEVFLGEMTFTPGAMGFRYVRDNDNLRIGKLLDISKVEKLVAPTVTQKKNFNLHRTFGAV